MTAAAPNACSPHAPFASGTWNSIHISVWCRGARGDDILQLRRELEAFHVSSRMPVGCVIVIPEGCSLAPEDGRREAARLLYDLYPHALGYCAIVIEGNGLGARAQRGVIGVISMLSRTPIPWDVFASCEDALRWLLPRVPDPREPVVAMAEMVAVLRLKL